MAQSFGQFTRGFFRAGLLFGTGIQLKPGRTIITNQTLGLADSGRIVFVGAADLVVTLPATIHGLWFTLVLLAAGLSTGTGLSISPNANDNIYGNGFTVADNKDAILTGATDRTGDNITLVGDGAQGYNILNVMGTWARET